MKAMVKTQINKNLIDKICIEHGLVSVFPVQTY